MEKSIELKSGAILKVSAMEIGHNILTTSYVKFPDGTKSRTTCTCTCGDGTTDTKTCDDGMDATCNCTGSASVSC